MPREELETKYKDAIKTVKHLYDKLNTNSTNSDMPPSTNIFGEGKEKDSDKDDKQKDKSDSDPKGKNPRDKGCGRKNDGIPYTQESHVYPTQCAVCNSKLDDSKKKPVTALYQYNVNDFGSLETALYKEKIHFYSIQCPCGHVNKETMEIHTPFGVMSKYPLIGDKLDQYINYLRYKNHNSINKIKDYFEEVYGISFSKGSISKSAYRLASKTEEYYEQIKENVLESELIHADETVFKNKFKSRYMWLFTNGFHYYFISGDRTKDIPTSILSEYKGMLCSDGYSPYRNHDNRIRCLAHILRKAKALVQSTDTKAQAFGNIVFLFLTTMFKRVEEARDNNLSSIDYTKELEELNTSCNAYLKCTHEKTRLLAVELTNDWDCFFKVLDDTSLPLTNNEAEKRA